MSRMALLVLLALAGCATGQQVAQHDDQTCRAYGAAPGSDAYVACRMQQQALRQQRTIEAADAISKMYPPPRRSLDCTSSAIGSSVKTNCD